MREDKAGAGVGILSLFLPIIGIVLFFVWKKDRPVSAKTVLITAIAGIAVWVVVSTIASGIGNAASIASITKFPFFT